MENTLFSIVGTMNSTKHRVSQLSYWAEEDSEECRVQLDNGKTFRLERSSCGDVYLRRNGIELIVESVAQIDAKVSELFEVSE